MPELAIVTDNLRKVYGSQTAVGGLTLEVPRGEIFGFLGPNGAGKSTSIKMLLGLVHPTAGRAEVLGRAPDDVAMRRRIGFLPEDFRFYDWLTGIELLDFHGRLSGMSGPALGRRIPEVLALVGLGGEGNRRIRGYSKGMLQRIGLAQAIIHEPELIFLDEPTSGLDPMGRRLVRDILRAERARGATVFLNSHLLSEIEVTCDQVAFIRAGEVVATHDLRVSAAGDVRVVVSARNVTPEAVTALDRWATATAFDAGQLQLHAAVDRSAARHRAAPGGSGRRHLRRHAGARLARGPLRTDHGGGQRPMNNIWIMARITWREAARRRILWTALLAALVLLAIFAIALRLQVVEFQSRAMSPFVRYQVESGMLMVGLYVCDLLAVVLTILTSIDTLAGEISSGTIHAVATKPVARWQILLGKYLGFTAMVIVYVVLTFSSTVAVSQAVTGVVPQHAVRGATLIIFECLVALGVTFLLGTWFTTLTTGVIALGLQAVAFLGGWLEQVSGFSQSVHIVTLGVVSSLIMPGESLWRRAAYEMQTPLAGSLSFSPFANVSIPSIVALDYAAFYLAVVVSVAILHFHRRDL